jgi:hypothetical protein
MGGGNKRAPLRERRNDLYETPPEATWALLKHERLPHFIWEPACGPGAIVRVLREAGHEVLASDLVDYGWPGQHCAGVDFLLFEPLPKQREPNSAIVTNPPYKLASEFAARAIELSPKVCMLLRLSFMSAGNKDDEAGRARKFALDGGHLARVLVFANRLPMMHRDDWDGPRAGSQDIHAWFVWDREHKGETVIKRIAWVPLTAAREAA